MWLFSCPVFPTLKPSLTSVGRSCSCLWVLTVSINRDGPQHVQQTIHSNTGTKSSVFLLCNTKRKPGTYKDHIKKQQKQTQNRGSVRRRQLCKDGALHQFSSVWAHSQLRFIFLSQLHCCFYFHTCDTYGVTSTLCRVIFRGLDDVTWTCKKKMVNIFFTVHLCTDIVYLLCVNISFTLLLTSQLLPSDLVSAS